MIVAFLEREFVDPRNEFDILPCVFPESARKSIELYIVLFLLIWSPHFMKGQDGKAKRYQITGLSLNEEILIPTNGSMNSVTTSTVGLEPIQYVFPWGNSNFASRTIPAFLPTMKLFPANSKIMNNVGYKMSVICSPGLITDYPVIDGSQNLLPKCTKCGAFVSSHTVTSFGQYTCPFCNTPNTCDSASLVLSYQGYDIIMPDIEPSKTKAVFCFIADVSIPSISSGYTAMFLNSLKIFLPQLDQDTCVIFATISDKIVVYDLARETEVVVSDLGDICIPNITTYPLHQVINTFTRVIDKVLTEPPSPTATGHCLGSMYQLLDILLQETGGLVLLQCFGIPTLGLVPPIDSKETTEHLQYRDIGYKLNKHGISIHLFLCTDDAYPDINVIAIPPRVTGNIHLYNNKNNMSDLYNDLFTTITDKYFWHCSFSMIFPKGVKLDRVHGNMISALTHHYMTFPVLGYHSAFAFDLDVTEEIKTNEVPIQTCMKWRTDDGRLVHRIFTMSMPVSKDISAIQMSIDELALSIQTTNQVIVNMPKKSSNEILTILNEQTKSAITKRFPTPSIYHIMHALTVSKLIQEANITRRLVLMVNARCMSVIDTILFLYPRLLIVDNGPIILPLAAESFSAGSVFMLHGANKIVIWVNEQCSAEYLFDAFGITDLSQLPHELPDINTERNQQIRYLLRQCYQISGRYLHTEIIGQGDPREAELTDFMVEIQPCRQEMSFTRWKQRLL